MNLPMHLGLMNECDDGWCSLLSVSIRTCLVKHMELYQRNLSKEFSMKISVVDIIRGCIRNREIEIQFGQDSTIIHIPSNTTLYT